MKLTYKTTKHKYWVCISPTWKQSPVYHAAEQINNTQAYLLRSETTRNVSWEVSNQLNSVRTVHTHPPNISF
jgi:hypothetical protein